jgi:hypothetical protein
MKKLQVLSLILFLCFCSLAFAQPQPGVIDPSATETPAGESFKGAADISGSANDPFRYYALSTTEDPMIMDSSLFEPLDPVWYDKAIRYQTYLQQTGNFGAAIFDPLRQNMSPYLISNGFNQYDRSMFRAIENRIELPSKRFTNINYHLGSKKEQHIFVEHNQRFRPWIVAGLKFGAQISPGEFTGQDKNVLNLNIYTLLSTKSRVYNAYLSFVSNRVLNEENGGIIDDSTFIEASNLETRTVPVFMNDGRYKNKTREYFVRQEFQPFKKSADWTGDVGIRHTFRYERQSLLFSVSDIQEGYFDQYYSDSVSTYDSTFIGSLVNAGELFFKRSNAEGELDISFGAEHQVVDYYTGGDELEPQSTALLASVKKSNERLKLGVQLRYGLNDFAEGAVLLSGLADYQLSEKLGVKATANYSSNRPALRELYYQSNHFRWNNLDFDKGRMIDYDITVRLPSRTSLTVSGILNKDFYYYETDKLPKLYGGNTALTEFRLSNFTYWGKVGVESLVSYFITSDDRIYPTPSFAFREQLYFRSILFRGAVNFRSGFIVRYNTRNHARGFMPATGIFYRQDEKETGGYLFIDYFMRFTIKATTLFIMVEHLNSGLGDREYFLTPSNPMPGRAFKFGFSWNFFD